jgi:hypothetical protein
MPCAEPQQKENDMNENTNITANDAIAYEAEEDPEDFDPCADVATKQRRDSRPTRVADSQSREGDWEGAYGIGWYRALVTPAKGKQTYSRIEDLDDQTHVAVELLDEHDIAGGVYEARIRITERARAHRNRRRRDGSRTRH